MHSPAKAIGSLGQAAALALLRIYRVAISPALGQACRYEPTCSVYAQQAIQRFGVLRGCLLAVRRILRCHPFARGGLDPVPADPASLPSHST
jgi:putative membrane protein insertion efficiency factor